LNSCEESRISLTDRSYWDETWESVTLPRPVDLSDRSIKNHATLKFHRYFSGILESSSRHNETIVEIGCAQSKWLAYFSQVHNLAVCGVDYSELGCARARELLARANCQGEIVQADMFDPPANLREKFDIVLSMGLVEHFPNTSSALRAIADFVKPGGLVITLIPNMTGILGFAQRCLDLEVYEKHVPLDRDALAAAHCASGLSIVRSEYLMSANLAVINHPNLKPEILKRIVRAFLVLTTGCIWALERIGVCIPRGRLFSPYVACVATKISQTD